MTIRIFVCVGIALLSGTAVAGSYQRTRDTKVLVWNDQPKAGQEVTWSGRKDAAGYATGYGTVTWFAPDRAIEAGSNIPSKRHMAIAGRFSGRMVQGKFVDRKQVAGRPTTGRNLKSKSTPAQRQAATLTKAAPPASIAATPAPTPSPTASATATPTGDSLSTLTHPPSSLQLNTPAETSPHPTPDTSVSPSP